MRFARLLAAAAALWVQPAHAAAIWNLHIAANATGQTTMTPMGPSTCAPLVTCPTIVTPVSGLFEYDIDVPAFVGSYDFFKTVSARTQISGTLLYDGVGFTGRNFLYYSNPVACTGTTGYCTETTARAETFSVFVNGASPAPEPATWAMMLVGFGAVGWAMRRKANQPQLRLSW